MTTLHMDIEAMLAVVKKLDEVQNTLNLYSQKMTDYVYGLPPDWQGHSAVEFFDKYETWRSAVTGIASSLGDISERLSGEISTWEAADSKF